MMEGIVGVMTRENSKGLRIETGKTILSDDALIPKVRRRRIECEM